MPSPGELAPFLCNSLPTLLPLARASVSMDPAPASVLEVASDELVEGEELPGLQRTHSRLFALWAGSQGMVGGTVHVGDAGPDGVVEMRFEDRRARVTLQRPGPFS